MSIKLGLHVTAGLMDSPSFAPLLSLPLPSNRRFYNKDEAPFERGQKVGRFFGGTFVSRTVYQKITKKFRCQYTAAAKNYFST